MSPETLSSIKLLLLDVDGVLTTGQVVYSDSGEEVKAFSVKDGLGLRMAMDSGIQVGIVTGRSSGALLHRCRNLGIDLVFDNVRNKAAKLPEITTRTGIDAKHMAFVGDDLPDIPLMHQVGLAIAVADAAEEVLAVADMVTIAKGGRGAVRETCEKLLKARGDWESTITRIAGGLDSRL
ncbi:MAG: HAD-IIIA family hydrolase [Desulfobacterales bacterium]|nr:HAD-IIIA family hydrolase [Desulfobacterales bacterium]